MQKYAPIRVLGNTFFISSSHSVTREHYYCHFTTIGSLAKILENSNTFLTFFFVLIAVQKQKNVHLMPINKYKKWKMSMKVI